MLRSAQDRSKHLIERELSALTVIQWNVQADGIVFACLCRKPNTLSWAASRVGETSLAPSRSFKEPRRADGRALPAGTRPLRSRLRISKSAKAPDHLPEVRP